MTALNQPFVVIDGQNVKYQANSVSTIAGKGEVNTRAMQLGGGATEALHTPNGETMFSKVKLTFESTEENKALVDSLNQKKESKDVFVLQVFEGESADVFENCMLTNDPEIGYGQDGSIAIEISGNKL